jgi:hypothetical protein
VLRRLGAPFAARVAKQFYSRGLKPGRILPENASLTGGLFLAAGTTRIPTLRGYLAELSALLLLTMLAVHPGLAQERAHPQAGAQEATARFDAGLLFLATVGFGAMDVSGWKNGKFGTEEMPTLAVGGQAKPATASLPTSRSGLRRERNPIRPLVASFSLLITHHCS